MKTKWYPKNIIICILAVATVCISWHAFATCIPNSLLLLNVLGGFAVGFLSTTLALMLWPPYKVEW